MPYDKEAKQIFNTISKAGDGKEAVISYTTDADPFSGSGGTEQTITVRFVQVSYDNRDIADGAIASGLRKVLVSPLTSLGVQIPDFTTILKNKSAYATLNGQPEKISIKLSRITMPDGVTPVVARLFLGG